MKVLVHCPGTSAHGRIIEVDRVTTSHISVAKRLLVTNIEAALSIESDIMPEIIQVPIAKFHVAGHVFWIAAQPDSDPLDIITTLAGAGWPTAIETS